MRNITSLGRTMFIYGSVLGFWYIVLPVNIITIITYMIGYGILGAVAFVIVGNISLALVSMLSKRFRVARSVFHKPRRW